MMQEGKVALLFGTMVLAACGQPAQRGATADDPMTTTTAAVPPAGGAQTISAATDPARYVTEAASSDQYEIQSSQLALRSTQNPQVRALAQRMIDDHTATTRALQQTVQQLGSVGGQSMAMPTEMSSRHQGMLVELQQSAQGGDRQAFDTLYLAQQRTAHSEAINLHREMANSQTARAALRETARSTLARVEQHRAMLGDLDAGATMGVGRTAGQRGTARGGGAADPTSPNNPGASGAAATVPATGGTAGFGGTTSGSGAPGQRN